MKICIELVSWLELQFGCRFYCHTTLSFEIVPDCLARPQPVARDSDVRGCMLGRIFRSACLSVCKQPSGARCRLSPVRVKPLLSVSNAPRARPTYQSTVTRPTRRLSGPHPSRCGRAVRRAGRSVRFRKGLKHSSRTERRPEGPK